ncbi:MAG: cbb3-type cytochrome c oxidase subunit II [Verrucomicrobiota bacterium]|jgi:cbb3-type cytochrome oxidase cytochrome c subunit
MKNGALVFLAVFVALGLSWCGFVLAPELQFGVAKETTILNSSDLYPVGRPGDATLGLQVYRANGCAACHTEQVRQSGVTCEVVLTDAGKNKAAVLKGIPIDIPPDLSKLPRTVLSGASKSFADTAVDQISAAGGKSEIHIVATGPDIARGWGMRRSVAEDYLYDEPVQLGSLRAGPDLSNAGVRAPDMNWQLVHLYAPPSEVKDSTMPPFRYLFEVRKIGGAPSPNALVFPKGFGPPAGFEVVPKPEAKELAAYLLSLRANVPLYSAPFTQ